MTYKELQRKIQTKKLLYTNPQLFNNDEGGGRFEKYDSLVFVLKDGMNNLYSGIADEAIRYFQENDIAWWGENKQHPSGHLLSSQVQCLNFLFALRKDKEAILRLAQLFDSEIDEVYPAISDIDPGYIAFEFTYDNGKLLNESDAGARRGEYCTSVDAFIIARRHGKKVLIPIEWKYTEQYPEGQNKALEKSKGETRQKRYNGLIAASRRLITDSDLAHSVYYYEPFYELMRQTLLAEQIVNRGIADDFLHVMVVSPENDDLLGNRYSFSSEGLAAIWTESLVQPQKFKLIERSSILGMLKELPAYAALTAYLKSRY